MQHLGRLSYRSVSSVSSNANSFLFKFYSTEAKKIGFIGLGNMGRHQAANLLKNGYQVVVLDKSPDAVSSLVAKGATSANTPKEIAEQADVIVTMLPASAHVKEVYSGKDGIFSAIKKGSLLLDSSTIDPSTAREVAKQAAEKGALMIDCPVSGGVGGAEAGTLTFMVGGSKEAFERAKEYLSAMGKNLVHCGDQGTGQVAKICNNLVLGISMIGVSEAMNLGVKNGMDPNILAGIFNTSTARCWSSDTYNPCPGVMPNVPSSRGYTGGFGSSLMTKDLGLAVEAAKTSGSTLGLGSEALKLYSLSSGSGYGNKDFSSMYEFLSKQPPKKEE